MLHVTPLVPGIVEMASNVLENFLNPNRTSKENCTNLACDISPLHNLPRTNIKFFHVELNEQCFAKDCQTLSAGRLHQMRATTTFC
jgi:hypothetical protein